jgi:hypothetical protein
MIDEPASTEAPPADWGLLAGEDPTSSLGEDAEHWVTVYAELARATHDMLQAAKARVQERELEPGVHPDVDRRELKYIATRLRFFEERLNWWVARGAELGRAAS